MNACGSVQFDLLLKFRTALLEITDALLVMVTSKHALRNILLLAFVLCFPGLFVDIHSDDYWHYAFINNGLPLKEINDASFFGLFSFVDGDRERFTQLVDIGFLPWWTYEGYKIVFWRPLTELTHWLDYTFWPTHGGAMHLQSTLWYLALLAVLYKLYGRFKTGKVAACSGFFSSIGMINIKMEKFLAKEGMQLPK